MSQVAVIIPARNMERWIGETLQSVADQDLEDHEVIVIDDGSTDATADIVEKRAAEDPRVRLYKGKAAGVSTARNLGFEKTDAPFVLFLDADDVIVADALTRMVATLAAAPEASAALGGVQRTCEAMAPLPGADNRAIAPDTDSLTKLLAKNYVVNGGALLIRSDAVRRAGGYDPLLVLGEDWEFWCRVACEGDFAIVPGEPLLLWRQRGGSGNQRVRVSTSALELKVPCIDAVAASPAVKARAGRRLGGLLRKRRMDWFWTRVRNEAHFGQRWRAGLHAAVGLVLFPDSVAQPRLFMRFVRSIRN